MLTLWLTHDIVSSCIKDHNIIVDWSVVEGLIQLFIVFFNIDYSVQPVDKITLFFHLFISWLFFSFDNFTVAEISIWILKYLTTKANMKTFYLSLIHIYVTSYNNTFRFCLSRMSLLFKVTYLALQITDVASISVS